MACSRKDSSFFLQNQTLLRRAAIIAAELPVGAHDSVAGYIAGVIRFQDRSYRSRRFGISG